ncbi:hypothetical protein HFP15_37365 [Amycolatopsis sp. K13G38]|uniref:Uncharacterized protein n=1 Tax=Amycolatopsis acididurans TaxID=2724524 RepID=A0ABX1JFF9_9PSEU|nr:hypothetical protein [Amycolatopsis acididurans]NKQ58532.1 hypothetical protein [Amycolatopsis acididurans]
MSDTRGYYHQLSVRARNLRDGVDDAINALLRLHQQVAEVGKADMDLPGVMRDTEHRDLQQCVESALFAARAAERITLVHISEVDHEIIVHGFTTALEEEGGAI